MRVFLGGNTFVRYKNTMFLCKAATTHYVLNECLVKKYNYDCASQFIEIECNVFKY